MALSVLQSQTPACSESEGLLLSGHASSILGACSWGDVCATSDARGIVLLWRVSEKSAENVCRLRTKHISVTDVAFTDASHITCAQGDGVVSWWNVETSKRERNFRRAHSVASLDWSVLNSVVSANEGTFVYGGDDGYVVQFNTRDRDASFVFNVGVPVTALSVANEFIYAGDVCGFVHCYDFRMNRQFFKTRTDDYGITGLAHSPTSEKLLVWSMNGKVELIDIKPFAFSSSDRSLGSIHLEYGGQHCLRRCDWSHVHNTIVFPCSGGRVMYFPENLLLINQFRYLRVSDKNFSVNIAHFVGDRYLLTAAGTDANIRSFH